MNRLVGCSFLALGAIFVSDPVLAQVGQGLSGPHYNLNIIGVPKGKKAPLTNGNRHTVFVPLNTIGELDGRVQIFFTAGDDFNVVDGNATDGTATIEVPHGDPGTVCYDAYATALGTPFGGAHVDANVLFDETDGAVLLELDQISFDAYRGRGKPVREDISDIFRVSGCIDLNMSLTCDAGDEFFNNEWVFNVDQLLSYWWDYTNTNLKLLQVRFYECEGDGGPSASRFQLSPESDPAAQPTTWGAIKSRQQ